MTIAASAIEGIQKAEAVLVSAATRLASNPQVAADGVCLSDIALAMIQARISMSANVSASYVAVKMQKALIDVMA